MKKAIPVRGERKGHFAGSVGAGATAPSVAPAVVVARHDGTPEVRRPLIPATPIVEPIISSGDLAEVFRASGVGNAREAARTLEVEYLDESGRFEVPAPLWEPAPAYATRSLLYGVTDAYEIDLDTTRHDFAIDTIDFASSSMDSRFPGSADCTTEILRERLTYVDIEDIRPVHSVGVYSQIGHEFTWRLNPETLVVEPGAPTTVGEVASLLSREDSTLSTVREVAVATSFRGKASLREGYWNLDADSIASEAVSSGMPDEYKYEILALAYSGGKSTNTGFDAFWEPAPGVTKPSPEVQAWLREKGRVGEWDLFGQWAVSGESTSPEVSSSAASAI